jgi:hypothetical protein
LSSYTLSLFPSFSFWPLRGTVSRPLLFWLNEQQQIRNREKKINEKKDSGRPYWARVDRGL